MTAPLKDKDPMPFGDHKGKPMGKVPAEYLDGIADKPWLSKWPAVKAYIDHNRAVIDKELEDPQSYGNR